MLCLEADSRYADVIERVLYNGFLSGVSLDGTAFFYKNPLQMTPRLNERDVTVSSRGDVPETTRLRVFETSCCPPNIARLIASLGGYICTRTDDTLFVHQYISARIGEVTLLSEFPASERPETTEGREGYYFIMSVEGGVEKCVLHGIIRDHDAKKFEGRKAFALAVAQKYNKMHGDRVKISLKEQYRNCAEVIAPHMHLVENVQAAMRAEGVEPITQPIRGGTDGSQLSYMGLPCPNICTGGRNAHGLNEFIAVQDMQKVVGILKRIVAAYAKKP